MCDYVEKAKIETLKDSLTQEKKLQNVEAPFAVETKNGEVINIGKSLISTPPIKFNGGTVKWFDDKKLIKR